MYQYDDLTLALIGAGGTEDDVTLEDYANEQLREVCRAVASATNEKGAPGKLTISCTVKRLETGGVVIVPDVKASVPSRRIRSLTADVTNDGEVLAQNQRQEPLRFRTVRVPVDTNDPTVQ